MRKTSEAGETKEAVLRQGYGVLSPDSGGSRSSFRSAATSPVRAGALPALAALMILAAGCGPKQEMVERPENRTIVVAADDKDAPALAGTETAKAPEKPEKPNPAAKPAPPGPKNESASGSASGPGSKPAAPGIVKPKPSPAKAKPAPSAKHGTKAAAKAGPSAALRASGTVKQASKAPAPGSVPYRDALVAVTLTDVRAESGSAPKEILVYLWGMRDNKPVPSARLREGQSVSLLLRPWAEMEEEMGGINRVELDDADALLLDAYWGEPAD